MLAERAAWWRGLPTVSTFRGRWGWRHIGHPLLGLSGETFVSIKQTGQGYTVAQQGIQCLPQFVWVSVCAGKIFRDTQSRNDVENEEERWRQGEREGKTEEEKRDRQREGLSLGLQTTVLFPSWSRMHSARGGSVFLFGVREAEGQQFIP